MKRKILLPTDFSNNSWLAINYALQLFKNEACDFYLLNAFFGTNNLIENIMNMGSGGEFFVVVDFYFNVSAWQQGFLGDNDKAHQHHLDGEETKYPVYYLIHSRRILVSSWMIFV